MTRETAIAWLTRDGGHLACFSRYGSTADDCAPVAWRLAEIIADSTGEPIGVDELDSAMSLVVNGHDDVASILLAHGTAEDIELADLADGLAAQARELGVEAGRAAGSWAADGNTSPEGAAAMLRALEDDGPDAFGLPRMPDLSGEWADELTPTTLLRDELGISAADDLDDATRDMILSAWEDGAADGWRETVEDVLTRAAAPVLDDDDAPRDAPRRFCSSCGVELTAGESGRCAICWRDNTDA